MTRYVYVVRTSRRPGARGFSRREVPSELVDASAQLTPAALARAEAAPSPIVPLAFTGLSDEDVASVFAAHRRGEVDLSGGRFTREPTVWNMRKRRR